MHVSVTTEAGPQHLKALQRANEVRLARAALKRSVASGEVSAADVILTCPAEVNGMAIGDLLMSQRRWGRTRCRRFLAAIEITETKQIGRLTERQRRAMASQLHPPATARRVAAPSERTAHRAPALAGVV